MKILLKLFLSILAVLIFGFIGLVTHFYFIEFTPEERDFVALKFSAQTLLTQPSVFFEMYRYDLQQLSSPEPDANLFSDEIGDDVIYRVENEEAALSGEQLFRGEVIMADANLELLGFTVDTAPSLELGSVVYSNVSCENTAVFERENYTFIKNTTNLFNEVEIGDIFEAQCANEDCSNLIGECILVKL